MVKAEVWAEDRDRGADREVTSRVPAVIAYALHAGIKKHMCKVFPVLIKHAPNAALK